MQFTVVKKANCASECMSEQFPKEIRYLGHRWCIRKEHTKSPLFSPQRPPPLSIWPGSPPPSTPKIVLLRVILLRKVETQEVTLKYKEGAAVKERSFSIHRTHHGPITQAVDGKWVATAMMWDPVNALIQSYTRTKLSGHKEFKRNGGVVPINNKTEDDTQE